MTEKKQTRVARNKDKNTDSPRMLWLKQQLHLKSVENTEPVKFNQKTVSGSRVKTSPDSGARRGKTAAPKNESSQSFQPSSSVTRHSMDQTTAPLTNKIKKGQGDYRPHFKAATSTGGRHINWRTWFQIRTFKKHPLPFILAGCAVIAVFVIGLALNADTSVTKTTSASTSTDTSVSRTSSSKKKHKTTKKSHRSSQQATKTTETATSHATQAANSATSGVSHTTAQSSSTTKTDGTQSSTTQNRASTASSSHATSTASHSTSAKTASSTTTSKASSSSTADSSSAADQANTTSSSAATSGSASSLSN